jgi:hypothetical protein
LFRARDLDEPVAHIADELVVEGDVAGLELPEEGLGGGVVDAEVLSSLSEGGVPL